MSALAEAAAAYLHQQPALAASVGRLDAHLRRCDAVLHPAPPEVDAVARATRRKVEAGLSNHQPAKVPTGRIACTVGELLSKAKEASATAANRYQANTLPR